MEKDKLLRTGAAGCGLVYIVLFLFLPFLRVRLTRLGLTGVDCLSASMWSYLVLLSGIAAIICAFAAPPKVAAIVFLAAALIPLPVFLIVRADLANSPLTIISGDTQTGLSSAALNGALTVGFGMVMTVIAGIGGAILCFLAGSVSPRREITPGYSANIDDEW